MAVRVLFLHTGGDWLRGSENALLMVLRGLDRKRVTPFLLCGNGNLAASARAEGIDSTVCPMHQVMIDGGCVQFQPIRWAKTFRTILALAKARNIDIVYCNGGSTCQVGYYVGKMLGLPVICHVHSPYNRRYILLYRLHLASRVIFVSKAVEKGILRKQPFGGRCNVVYNGVDTDRFQPASKRDLSWRARLSLPPDGVVFGQVSSLIHRKGVDILLRAFQLVNRRHPESRLVLVGDGPNYTEFLKLANELAVADKVQFLGNQADPLPYYQHVLDSNVLASRSDAFPLSLLEAAACGLPSIGANVDGIGEAIQDCETGLLFESEHYQMLADKMSLLVSDAVFRKRLGEANRKSALQRFSKTNYCDLIQSAILEEAGLVGRGCDSTAAADTRDLPAL